MIANATVWGLVLERHSRFHPHMRYRNEIGQINSSTHKTSAITFIYTRTHAGEILPNPRLAGHDCSSRASPLHTAPRRPSGLRSQASSERRWGGARGLPGGDRGAAVSRKRRKKGALVGPWKKSLQSSTPALHPTNEKSSLPYGKAAAAADSAAEQARLSRCSAADPSPAKEKGRREPYRTQGRRRTASEATPGWLPPSFPSLAWWSSSSSASARCSARDALSGGTNFSPSSPPRSLPRRCYRSCGNAGGREAEGGARA